MMTWTKIKNTANIISFIGVVTCALLLNTSTAFAVDCMDPASIRHQSQQSNCTSQAHSNLKSYIDKDSSNCLMSLPLENPSAAGVNISSVPGYRARNQGDHKGMDVGMLVTSNPANETMRVLAPAQGKVVTRTWGNKAGRLLEIDHPISSQTNRSQDCTTYRTRIMHLHDFSVNVGAIVAKGQPIGIVGGSNCTRPSKGAACEPHYEARNASYSREIDKINGYDVHLHYEVRSCKEEVFNPLSEEAQNLCKGVKQTTVDPADYPDTAVSSTPASSVPQEDCEQYHPYKLEDCSKYPMPTKDYVDCDNRNQANQIKRKTTSASFSPEYKKYNECLQRNADAKKASENSNWTSSSAFGYSYSGSSGSSGGGDMKDFESNYQCNISEYYSSIEGCMFCDLFKIIFKTASSVAQKCHNTFASSMITLLVVALAIWLAQLVMTYISDMTVQDPARMLDQIFRKIFVVVFIILLLKLDVKDFFDLFVTPVMNTGFKLAALVMDADTSSSCGNWGLANGGLPVEMGNCMLYAIDAIQERLEHVLALGSNSVCIALFVKSYHGYPIFPHFGYLLTGVFLWLIAVVFMLAYPFLLIDSVLQFTIASALFPVALASTAFKVTSGYLNIFKIINIFINAMFVFIFLTIVLFILLSGIDSTVKPVITEAYQATSEHNNFSLATIAWYSVTFVKLVFFLFLGKAVLEDIPNFAENFAKAITNGQGAKMPDLGGRALGGLAVGAATKLTTQVGGKALSTGYKGAKAVGQNVGAGVSEVVKKARYNYLLNRTQSRMLAAEAAGGIAGAAVTGRTFWGQKVTRKVVTNPDGSFALESSRKGFFNKNNTIVTRQNEHMEVKTKTHKDGSINESYSIKSPFARSLINSDGTRNDVAVNSLLQSTGLSKDDANKVILNQMLKQRMPNADQIHLRNTFGKVFGNSKIVESANLEGKFVSEEIINSKDDKGHDVFSVRRKMKDGSVSVFTMTKGAERDLVEFEHIDKKGNAVKFASDGIIQKQESYAYDLNKDGTFKVDNQVMINGAQSKDSVVTADGAVLDKDGNDLGKVQANGNIVDAKGNVVGTANTTGLAFDQNGKALGKITAQGTIINDKGKVTGTVAQDGSIIDQSGTIVGKVSNQEKANLYNNAQKKNRKVEFSHSKAYKGRTIFDDDGIIEDDMRDEELMFGDSDLALYMKQMKKYGDVLQHRSFGR